MGPLFSSSELELLLLLEEEEEEDPCLMKGLTLNFLLGVSNSSSELLLSLESGLDFLSSILICFFDASSELDVEEEDEDELDFFDGLTLIGLLDFSSELLLLEEEEESFFFKLTFRGFLA